MLPHAHLRIAAITGRKHYAADWAQSSPAVSAVRAICRAVLVTHMLWVAVAFVHNTCWYGCTTL
jgi:hypothetical protein